MKSKRERLIEAIKEKPLHQDYLAWKLDVETRTVRKMIRNLREEGLPIGSGNEGYFYAKSPDELEHTINRLKAQNRSHVEMIFKLEDAYKVAK